MTVKELIEIIQRHFKGHEVVCTHITTGIMPASKVRLEKDSVFIQYSYYPIRGEPEYATYGLRGPLGKVEIFHKIPEVCFIGGHLDPKEFLKIKD